MLKYIWPLLAAAICFGLAFCNLPAKAQEACVTWEQSAVRIAGLAEEYQTRAGGFQLSKEQSAGFGEVALAAGVLLRAPPGFQYAFAIHAALPDIVFLYVYNEVGCAVAATIVPLEIFDLLAREALGNDVPEFKILTTEAGA